MDFWFDRSVTGSKKFLTICDGKRTWNDDLPQGMRLSLSASQNIPNCFNTLLELNGLTPAVLPPEQFVRAMTTVMSSSVRIPWQLIVPKDRYNRFIDFLAGEARKHSETVSTDYYIDTYQKCTQLFSSLQPATINKLRFKEIAKAETNTSQIDVLKSFLPVNEGMTEQIVYDRLNRTGRLGVTSGPEILRIKREYRNILTSRFENGNICYLDYMSLEPRIALLHAKRPVQPDIYDHISHALLGGEYDRNLVKQVTISELYGAGLKTLSEQTGLSHKKLKPIHAVIKQYFDIEKVSKDLVTQCIKRGGSICNAYGRVVKVTTSSGHIVFNAFVQSTAVDYALLGFTWIVEQIKIRNLRVVPLFILHDALIVDCHSDDMKALDCLREEATRLSSHFDAVFPIKFEVIK